MTNDITNIPLNLLTEWEGNVRKTQNKGFIEELAASIKAHGLQQNLVVRKDGGKFPVVAGKQRHKALKLLAANGDIKANHPVPCKIRDADADGTELSLVENVVRSNMHPADEFEAFRALIDGGKTVTDVAARFGVTEKVVAQRLKLARVSPVVLKAYRKETLTLEHVMAFAVSDDHEAQERLFKDMPPWSEAGDIRAALTESDIASTDKRVEFVTLKAYEGAGGTLRRDLFSEEVFILDAELLDRLVREKLEKTAKRLRKEGWKWVEVHPDFGYEARNRFHRKRPELSPLPPDTAAELQRLQAEYDKLVEECPDGDEDEERQLLVTRLEDQINLIEDRDEIWPSETLAIAGAVVSIGHDGKVDIERGLVRPEDMPKGKSQRKSSAAAGPEKDDGPSSGLSAALVESLTALKSAAITLALEARPDVALAAVVHAFASDVVLNEPDTSSLQIVAKPQSHLCHLAAERLEVKLETSHEDWANRICHINDVRGGLWQWCLEQPQDVLLDLLAHCVSTSVNAVRRKQDNPDSDRLAHADWLASALQLDMKEWFKPTAENYFSRVSKDQILADLREARGTPPAPAWEKLTKSDLAKLAERELADSGWLPALLRTLA